MFTTVDNLPNVLKSLPLTRLNKCVSKLLRACADDTIPPFHLSTDQVWKRGMGGWLSAVREEE